MSQNIWEWIRISFRRKIFRRFFDALGINDEFQKNSNNNYFENQITYFEMDQFCWLTPNMSLLEFIKINVFQGHFWRTQKWIILSYNIILQITNEMLHEKPIILRLNYTKIMVNLLFKYAVLSRRKKKIHLKIGFQFQVRILEHVDYYIYLKISYTECLIWEL